MGKKKTSTAEAEAILKEVEEIGAEAREGYDLSDRLRNKVKRRTKTVTVYTDEEAGELLGGAEGMEYRGKVIGQRRWGLYGDMKDLADEAKSISEQIEGAAEGEDVEALELLAADLEERLAAKVEEVKAAQKALQASAIKLTLQGVPDLIKTDVARQARAALNIKKGVSIEGNTDYDVEYDARLLAAAVVKLEDVSAGAIVPSITLDGARSLQTMLPQGEYPKILAKLSEVCFQSAISDSATESVDF